MSPEVLTKPQPPCSIATHVSPHTDFSRTRGWGREELKAPWTPPRSDSSGKCLACEAMKGLTIMSSNLSPCDIPWAVPGGESKEAVQIGAQQGERRDPGRRERRQTKSTRQLALQRAEQPARITPQRKRMSSSCWDLAITPLSSRSHGAGHPCPTTAGWNG